MQSTRWTSGCPRVNLALAWCCVPSEAARRATIIIKGEEADADGSARLGQLLRCPFAGLLQRSQCWRHKEQRRAKDALARRCVVGCGLGKGGLRVCNVLGVYTFSFLRNRQWGAAPFTLAHVTARVASQVNFSKFGPFCNGRGPPPGTPPWTPPLGGDPH